MKTKDASNWFIAILSVGVILSILFVFKFRNASSKTQTNPTSAPPIVNTEGWKTVVFPRYKFSLKLPPGWAISSNLLTGDRIPLNDSVTVVENDYANLINVYKNNEAIFAVDMGHKYPEGFFVYKKDEPEINNIVKTFEWN